MNPIYVLFRHSKILCLLAICFLSFQDAFSQRITYDTTFSGWNVRVTYSPTADSTEGIVFMPGVGEVGSNAGALQLYGPHYWLTRGWDGGVELGNGKHYPILISIQQPVENSRPWTLKPVIDGIMNRYKIKRNALHFTAISQGCWVLNQFITYMPNANDYSYVKLVKSMVNVQGMNPSDTYGATLPFAEKMGHWASRFGGRELGFEQVNDTRNINRIVSNMNDSINGSGKIIWTAFGGGGHSNFNDFYDPNQKNWTLSNPNVRAKKGSVETLPIEGGQNIWQWMLRQGDTLLAGQTSQPPPVPNSAPVAIAGNNQSITLPISSTTLDGSASRAASGTIVSHTWTKISGPLSFSILNILQPITLVNSLVQGEYRFELKVVDSQGLIGKDTVTVTVNAAPNAVPVANAGNDVQLTLPVNATTLAGSGTDTDDLLLSYKWTKISGPGQFNILTPTLPITLINNLVAGTYQFELAVTDSKNATGKDTVQVTVVSPVNNPPVAFAGSDVQVTLPVNLVTLTGSATDPDDLLLTYKWTKISGPAQFNILTPSLPVTIINNLVQGVYQFELTATDSKNASGRDTVRVTVNPAPAAGCVANAGVDQIIPRSQGFAVLDGSASVGTTFKWRRLTTVDFDFKANVKRADSAKADVLILPYRVGGYDFELVATSFGCVSKDTVNIKVDYGQAPPQSTDGPAGWHYATAADVSAIPAARLGDVIINGARSNTIETGEFSSVYIYPTSPINLGPGKKVLIKGGKYSSVVLNFGEGQVVGSGKDPVIITNYGGQVETQMMTVTNAVNAKITGKYVPGVSGDVNFKGHAEGKYAFSRGTYGIYCNNNWSSLASVGLKINGEKTDSLEIEYVEIGNGNFAGVQIKQDAGTNDYDGFHIHDIYIHDIHGEGMYLGSTSSGQRHKLNGWLLQNIRIVNSGNELFQMGNIGANTRIRNNVFINSATNWKSPFNLYQDNGIQLSFNNGNCEFRNNIVLGAGTQTFNGYSGLRPDLPYNGDSIFINNNLMKYSRGFIGGYWGSGSVPINGLVVKLDSNYFGGFQFAGNEVYNNTYAVNTNTLLRTVTNGTRYVVRNTVSDGTKSLAVTGGNIDTSGTVVRNITNPQFVNSGWPADFNWNKLYEWSDFIFATWGDENVTTTANVKWKTPVYFNQGDLVLFLSKVYKSKIANNHGHMPHGVTDEYWELQTWNDGGNIRHFPADDYRLVDGDEYKQRNIGLTTSAVQPTNQLPIVNAGNDIAITLPVSSATLIGTASDPDGNIASSVWKKIAGPNSFNIQNPAQLQSGITNLVEGVYRFELTVTDNRGGIAKDTVQVTVRPAQVNNLAPIALAGPDKVVTLPVNTVTLNGSGTDPENTAITYRWYYLSGPAQHTITSPNQAVTVINNLVQGSYKFVLEVKDVQGLTGKDTVNVTVNVATPVNQFPVAYTGGNLTITLPVNTVTANGSQSYDPDGSIQSYNWTKIEGPTQFNIVSATQAQTAINNLVQGVYRFELKVTDNSGAVSKDTMTVIVNAAPVPNQAPVSVAGLDQTITLPLNTVTLNGTGSYDPDGSIVSYKWNKIAGPAAFNIVSSTQAQSAVSNLAQGVYKFELVVTDNKGATGKDTVQITVNAAPPANIAPVADAGNDRVITLPANSLTVSGAASYDTDGSISAYFWTKISGPTAFTIATPAQAQTAINGLVQGVYKFELRVTDNKGAIGKDTIVITVNPAAPNQAPVANAGNNVTITLPTNSLTLNGSSSYDPDGTITAYQWTKLNGPAQFTIATPTQRQTLVSNLVQGTYSFVLMVTDNSGATAKDTVTVIVDAGVVNQLPVANAGTSIVITLPVNTITANGGNSYDPDGTIVTYTWTKVAGPGQFNIASPSQKQTVINNLVQGIYKFELKVTDNKGALAKDTLVVTVNPNEPAPNQLPVADAGENKTITFPVDKVVLDGSKSYDPDGIILTYQWSMLSGPSRAVIVGANAQKAEATELLPGEYRFKLVVTDNRGGQDDTTVVVNVIPTESSARVYPNPAHNTINVAIESNTHRNNTYLRIFDAFGKMVYQEQFVRNTQRMIKTVDITTLAKGAYFINIGVDINHVKTVQFIKQ